MELIKFEKDNCKPCENLGKYLDSKNIAYTKINAFDSPELAAKYQIRSLPTMIKIDGENVDNLAGFNIDKLKEFLKDYKN